MPVLRQSRHLDRKMLPTSCYVPYPNSFVESSGYQKIRVRVVVHTENEVRVADECFHFTALNELSPVLKISFQWMLTSSILQILIVLSSDADAIYSPSLAQAISDIPSVWPSNVSSISPVMPSQSLMTLSEPVLHYLSRHVQSIWHVHTYQQRQALYHPG